MNRGPSPIFDVPEFPTLRRVKPLPKRRRTSATGDDDDDDPAASASATTTAAALPSLAALGLPFPLPGPDATAEELIAHAESLSAHMALQSYYMPGLQDIFSKSAELAGAANGLGLNNNNNMNLNGNYGEDDGEDGDEDGMEHLQQPGNTKKRKVPATNASASPDETTLSGGEEDNGNTDRGNPSDEGSGTVDVYQPPSGSPFAGLGIRKGRPPPITLAGLQHKETLKSRKRQLAAVLGALSHGDTLALDQALSANYPFVGMENAPPPRVRISRRHAPRLARAARFSEKYRHPDKRPFLECAFTFARPSSTADRLVATKEEVTMLRGRFEAELARQAAKAAKLAAANKLMAALPATGGGGGGGGKSKQKRGSGGNRDKDRTQASRIASRSANNSIASTATTTTTTTTTTTSPANAKGDDALLGLGSGKEAKPSPRGKKKKRSALANASNPHHLRNYVPSRLPHSSPSSHSYSYAHTANANTHNPNGADGILGPLPLRFLSADIPPRRRRGAAKGSTNSPSVKTPAQPPADSALSLTHPADEWICAFCEYDLFYGDDAAHRRAVRSRKKILKRRRRARERAARAASGGGARRAAAFKGKENAKEEEEYEMHPGWAPGAPVDGMADVPRQTRWRGTSGVEKEGGRAELGAG